MNIAPKLFVVAAVLVAVAGAAHTLYALEGGAPSGSALGAGMIYGRHMGMMGMGSMLSGCTGMMQRDGDTGHPNDQWRDHPSQDDDD
jgi:hypothetical protein